MTVFIKISRGDNLGTLIKRMRQYKIQHRVRSIVFTCINIVGDTAVNLVNAVPQLKKNDPRVEPLINKLNT